MSPLKPKTINFDVLRLKVELSVTKKKRGNNLASKAKANPKAEPKVDTVALEAKLKEKAVAACSVQNLRF
jgi:hypothetical protein